MAPELHVRLQVSLSDITYHVTPKADGSSTTSSPDDLDVGASGEAIGRVTTIIESLGGRHARKTSSERGQREDAYTITAVEKVLAEFDDGVAGRAFVEQAWPVAAGWLRNKETRRFRIKYGEEIVELAGPAEVERALGLMKDAVPAPKPKKAAKARKAQHKAKAKASPKPKAAATHKAKAPKKGSKKTAPKKAPAKAAKKAPKKAKKRR